MSVWCLVLIIRGPGFDLSSDFSDSSVLLYPNPSSSTTRFHPPVHVAHVTSVRITNIFARSCRVFSSLPAPTFSKSLPPPFSPPARHRRRVIIVPPLFSLPRALLVHGSAAAVRAVPPPRQPVEVPGRRSIADDVAVLRGLPAPLRLRSRSRARGGGGGVGGGGGGGGSAGGDLRTATIEKKK